MKKKWIITLVLVALCGMAQASFVTIGHAGNAADTADGDPFTDGVQRYGAVGYAYQISATEVTIAEFQASGAGNGNENYWNDGVRTVGSDAPASRISVYSAMKYCNYITSGDINLGAYIFSAGIYQSTDRASAISAYGTVYALPTEDEWYKAAYFKPDASGYSLYANGTGTAPVAGVDANYDSVIGSVWVVGTGTVEQNGTYDMMGNVSEWMEKQPIDGAYRGGSYSQLVFALPSSSRSNTDPSIYNRNFGLRVVAVPEPASALLIGCGGLLIVGYRRMRKSYGHF